MAGIETTTSTTTTKNQMQPEISVILPVFNTKVSYLQESIASVLNQTFKRFELLIIDDGSTDENCVEFLNSFSSMDDERIQLKRFESNQGLIKVLNFGIENSNCPV